MWTIKLLYHIDITICIVSYTYIFGKIVHFIHVVQYWRKYDACETLPTCGVSSLGFGTALVCHLCNLTQSNEAWALGTSKATPASTCKSSTCNQLHSLLSKRVHQTLMQTMRRKDILPCRFVRVQNSKTNTFFYVVFSAFCFLFLFTINL